MKRWPGRKNTTLFIELTNDGSYWNVNSGGYFRNGYTKKKKGTDSSDGFAANTTAPITPLATPDNLSSNSDGKVNALPGEKQAMEVYSNKNSKKEDETAQSLGAWVYAAAAEIDTQQSEAQKATGKI